MSVFAYQSNELTCEAAPLARLAREFGTPLYVYSANALRANYRRLAAAFAALRPLICYAVKANFNLSLLRILKEEGAGFDIVSGGELHRALTIGADAAHLVFAGVGKTDAELRAGLRANIGWFNVESADELARLNALAAARGQTATVALRLNPDVAPDTHQHIATGGGHTKFGLPVDEALTLVRRAAEYPAVRFRGVHIHIGSQIPDPTPTLRAIEVALNFIHQSKSVSSIGSSAQAVDFNTLDIGGGFPVAYQETDTYPRLEDFAAPIVARLAPLVGLMHFHLEPGRFLVANTGALLTTVQAIKTMSGRRTIVVDAGMNTLLRPALYDAYHRVLPLHLQAQVSNLQSDVVGPICESADVLARDRHLPELRPGAGLALMEAGAYGFSMASNYNAQPRPAEVLVDGETARLIRQRETLDDLMRLEL